MQVEKSKRFCLRHIPETLLTHFYPGSRRIFTSRSWYKFRRNRHRIVYRAGTWALAANSRNAAIGEASSKRHRSVIGGVLAGIFGFTTASRNHKTLAASRSECSFSEDLCPRTSAASRSAWTPCPMTTTAEHVALLARPVQPATGAGVPDTFANDGHATLSGRSQDFFEARSGVIATRSREVSGRESHKVRYECTMFW